MNTISINEFSGTITDLVEMLAKLGCSECKLKASQIEILPEVKTEIPTTMEKINQINAILQSDEKYNFAIGFAARRDIAIATYQKLTNSSLGTATTWVIYNRRHLLYLDHLDDCFEGDLDQTIIDEKAEAISLVIRQVRQAIEEITDVDEKSAKLRYNAAIDAHQTICNSYWQDSLKWVNAHIKELHLRRL